MKWINALKITVFLIAAEMILAGFQPCRAAEALTVKNVHFEMRGSAAIIYYDFVPARTFARRTAGNLADSLTPGIEETVPEGEIYNVAVSLRRKSDPHFLYRPRLVSGDVGRGQFGGKNLKIVWDVGRELPNGLAGSDYFFEVRVRPVEINSRKKTLWMAAGAALLAGGVVTYVVLSQSQETQSNNGFPAPPGRPK
ncbi:MAG TPA: hypothetical protein VMM58_05730 [Bacteroidota bacterium]|nr:hypothetical protein [Bacteroidota bacterium]